MSSSISQENRDPRAPAADARSPVHGRSALLVASKALLSRAASAAYAESSGRAALCAELERAGLDANGAARLADIAEAAVGPWAADLRAAQAHAAANASVDYLVDVDWQAQHDHRLTDEAAAARSSPIVQ